MIYWQYKGYEYWEKLHRKTRALLRWNLSQKKLIFLFIIAFFLGFSVKSLVHESLTIGYDDYRLVRNTSILDLNLVQQETLRDNQSLSSQKITIEPGASCSDTQD